VSPDAHSQFDRGAWFLVPQKDLVDRLWKKVFGKKSKKDNFKEFRVSYCLKIDLHWALKKIF
jgi:hypothetical protein